MPMTVHRRRASFFPAAPSSPPGTYNQNVLPAWNLTGTYEGQPVIVRANAAYAGCIYSIQWGNWEFINPEGHGGQLQTATFLDNLQPDPGAENPTEAGAAADLNGPHSTSRLLYADNGGNVLRTVINPAYWEPYMGRLVSPDTFAKTVDFVMPNVLRHRITVIEAEPHSAYACVIITGYLNFAMWHWHQYDPATKTLTDIPPFPPVGLTGASRNSNAPVIATEATGNYAFTNWWKPSDQYGFGYGWGGNYPITAILDRPFNNTPVDFRRNYTVYTVFGSLASVKDTLDQLYANPAVV